MKKTTWFYICTLGIGYLIAKKRAKELANKPSDTIKVSIEIGFDIGSLVSALGGQDNIIETNATINNLKIRVRDTQVLDTEKIKSFGAKGSFVSDGQITILFGDNSQAIAKAINDYLIPFAN